MNSIRYFGYGPYESYVDKHHACVKHMYDSTVKAQHEDYIRRQENGSHWNCDYLRLTGPLGGFEISGDEFRTSPTLIHFIKTYGSEAASNSCSNLKVVNIPDNATDWRIEEYDGLESIIYVVDGKMYDLY
jgi:hypothetical protein